MQQNQAAAAYQQVAKRTTSPRDLEANLLTKSATNMQRVRDNWGESDSALGEALHFNRRLWTVFVTSVTRDDNPLPAAIRQNIANLGIFVMTQTREVLLAPEPRKLDSLININRQLAAGLRNQPPA